MSMTIPSLAEMRKQLKLIIYPAYGLRRFCRICKINHSTLSRFLSGKPISVETYIKLNNKVKFRVKP